MALDPPAPPGGPAPPAPPASGDPPAPPQGPGPVGWAPLPPALQGDSFPTAPPTAPPTRVAAEVDFGSFRQPPAKRRSHAWVGIGAALVGIAVLALGGYYATGGPDDSTTTTSAPASPGLTTVAGTVGEGESARPAPAVTAAPSTDAAGATSVAPTTTAAEPAPAREVLVFTSTTPLADASTGTCRSWTATGSRTGQTTTVPCEQPHAVELVAAAFTAGTGDNPTDDELIGEFGDGCVLGARDFLGGGVAADVTVAVLRPSADMWSAGDHLVACAVVSVGSDGEPTALTGPTVARAGLLGVQAGMCLQYDVDTGAERATSCDEPHELDVLEVLPLSAAGSTDPFMDTDQQAAMTQDACSSVAEPYVAASRVHGPVTVSPARWLAGERTVWCVLAEEDPSGAFTEHVGLLPKN